MDYQAITFICELTEGLPLAIELAAAWTKSMSCLEIAQAVESSLDALTTFQTDWSPRHRSIRAAFDHSWTLLSAVERDAFQRVATFPADFDRETALRITAVDLPLLTALTDKSLLRRNPDGRYEMHELLRLFAREKGTRSSQQLALNML
jgi:predicted ATPase